MKKYVLVLLVIIFAAGLVWFGTLDQEAQDGLLEPAPQAQAEQTPQPSQQEASSLTIQSEYEGVLPAADCPGIKTTLTLYTNGTYQLQEEYLERDASFTQTGAFTLQGDVLTLEQQNDGPRYFRLAQDSATMLDRSQQPITGALAAHYVLRKK